jgi:hypothetical protein
LRYCGSAFAINGKKPLKKTYPALLATLARIKHAAPNVNEVGVKINPPVATTPIAVV